METLSLMFIVPIIFFFFSKPSFAVDTITKSQSLSDGSTLVSKGRRFELGFFSPGSSKNHYLGIWYKNISVRTIVWVANRSNPIKGSSGILMINSTGNGSLVLSQNNKTVVWSTTTTTSLKQAQNPVLQLLDSGNLVLREENDGNPENYLWQSFDYPTDTLLPGMKHGLDLKTGLNRRLTAWKNSDDPSPGDFTFEMLPFNYPEALMKKGSEIYFRTGPWNGLGFSGLPMLEANSLVDFNLVSNADEVYFVYTIRNKDVISIEVLNQSDSSFQQRTWIETEQMWKLYISMPIDHCDNYGVCGAYGNCIISLSPFCRCLRGFKPKSQEKWESMDWSQGCVRNKPLICQDKDKDRDVFVKFDGLKMPDTNNSWMNARMNLKDCKVKCLNNCSCMAYSNSDIREGGSGCAMWFGDLIDIRQVSNGGGQDLYIRMSASELEAKDDHKMKIAVILVAFIAVVFGMLVVGYCIWRSRTKFKEASGMIGQNNEDGNEDMELPMFDLSTIGRATDNFSINNKLGEGGFGPVYRGVLVDGQEIAVKRLSRSSGQGLNEFKNEVALIAKLQHRNLVRLLGCCIQGEENMLVYEYMPNKSLDFLIFDQTSGTLLNWSKRFQIICGIARGLLYLHQDSRLRIIHRDLKASNVLLDSEMNPKISDFGMARIFGGDETEGNTNRVVGTFGYMAPEYAIEGLFSTKSDVYSFGVLLLEIVSGKKNRGFYHQDQNVNLIGYAWILWKEDRPLELMDASLGDSHTLSEVLRCIHVSLLCVQHSPEDRPTMSSVVLMLSSEGALPQPKQPGFFFRKESHEAQSSSSKLEISSTNEITVTLLESR